MAKKVKKDGERKEEKKAVFEPPVFNEREWLEEQLHNVKLTILFVILGVPTGLIWAVVASSTGSTLLGFGMALGVYAAGVYILKGLFDIDVIRGPKKVIGSTLLMFIFTALAFAVLFSNPPVMDNTTPSITDVMVDYNTDISAEDNWDILMRHRSNLEDNKTNRARKKANPDQKMFLHNTSNTAEVGDTIAIMVRAADASGLRGVWVKTGYDSIDSPPEAMTRLTEDEWKVMGDGSDYTLVGEHYYQYRLTTERSGNLYYRITVEDMAGHTKVFDVSGSDDSVFVEEATPED